MPNLVRTPDRHSPLRPRTPELTRSAGLSLPGSRDYRRAPPRPARRAGQREGLVLAVGVTSRAGRGRIPPDRPLPARHAGSRPVYPPRLRPRVLLSFPAFLSCSDRAAAAAATMGHQQLYWSHPRKFGQGSRSCRVCSNRHGLIRKYGLNMCRQCFRQYARDIGFVKMD
ncbi:UNVERIFIED_CONTAM: hypothetical protein K2H54_007815 [Gekko kuhli]